MATVKIWFNDTPQTDAMSPEQLKEHCTLLAKSGMRSQIQRGIEQGSVSYTDDNGFFHAHEWKIIKDDDVLPVDVAI